MQTGIKKKLLGDIADVRGGYTFREKIDEISSGGNAHVAQIKDVRSAWEQTYQSSIQAHQLPYIHWEGKDNAYADPEDILIPSRGSRGGYFRASYVMAETQSTLPIVVSSQFLVITVKPGVLPEFVCWLLNQPLIQHRISEGAGGQGTSLVMLNTRVAKELEVLVPDFETQKKIVRINQLWEQEQQLNRALLKNREVMLQGMFQHLLAEGK